MGVKDLWKILECSGHPVTLESLEGLILAIDVSIWLNQAVKGARDRHGEMLKGAHLAVLFSRICKLLHYRIKPVFVFDGPPPSLKLQTLRSRNQRRQASSQKLLKNADKRLSKYLQASVLNLMSGEEGPLPLHPTGPAKPSDDDIFWLPPLPTQSSEVSPGEEVSSPAGIHGDDGIHGDGGGPGDDLYHQELADLDVHSEQFACLPPETQHDLLLEKQRYEKYTYHHPSTLPQVADDFSNYQLARLVKRNRISQKLEQVRHVLKSGEAAVTVGDTTNVHHVETNRVVSSDHTHYILVRGSGLESSVKDRDSSSEVCLESSEHGPVPISRDLEPILVTSVDMENVNKIFDIRKDRAVPSDMREIVTPSGMREIATPDMREIATPDMREIATPSGMREIVTPSGMREIVTPSGMREIATPSDTREIVTPSDMREIVTPSGMREIATPDMREIATPDMREIATPSGMREIVTPSGMREIVTPSDMREIVTPSDMREIATPSDTREIVTPSDMREIVTPSGMREIVTPSGMREIVTPSGMREIATPSGMREIAISSQSLTIQMGGAKGDHSTTGNPPDVHPKLLRPSAGPHVATKGDLWPAISDKMANPLSPAISTNPFHSGTLTSTNPSPTSAVVAMEESTSSTHHPLCLSLTTGREGMVVSSEEGDNVIGSEAVGIAAASERPGDESFSRSSVMVTLGQDVEGPLRISSPPSGPLRISSPPSGPLRISSPPSGPLRISSPPSGPLRISSPPSGPHGMGPSMLMTDSSVQFITSSGEESEDEGVAHKDQQEVEVIHCGAVNQGEGLSSNRSAPISNRSAPEEADNNEMEALFSLPVGVARDQVRVDVERLEEERRREMRDEATVESHMYQDARELLALFGIPYLLSPGEAEAQCATLELLGLTNGTITDDNDVFLFGGSTVYRHFFSQDHHPEKYTMEGIRGQLGLPQKKLIALAYLLGSDYTDGLEGIGAVSAMEFLKEFEVEDVTGLEKFRQWHKDISSGVGTNKDQTTSLKRKLSHLVLPHGFPNKAVQEAYINPRVNQSRETFNWAKPDLDLIRKFAASHIGWSAGKVDGLLLPVIKKMNAPESQQKLTRFVSLHHSPGKKMAAMSRRMRKAVGKLRTMQGPALSSSGSDSDEDTNPPKRARGQGKDKGQRSLVQAPQPSGSESEFDGLANEIILREQEEGVGSGEGPTKRRGGRGRGRGRRK